MCGLQHWKTAVDCTRWQSDTACIINATIFNKLERYDDVEDILIFIIYSRTLLYADPITFYSTVCGYRKMEYAQTSNWVFLQPAELLFTYASSLIFKGDRGIFLIYITFFI